jgi:CII-binding regulator of phage lambda lysogenization HflD
MDHDFINLYIERLIAEVVELTKTKLILETRLQFNENANQKLIERIQDLEKQVEKKNKKVLNNTPNNESITTDTF